ncbi:MAG: NfeD family protein [Candidatus Nanopelagicales bacterium]|jgi:membrane protein implicated in regulation of membrane protease activity
MEPWTFWVIAALVLGIAEVVTGGALVLGMVGVGALAGGLTAALTGSEWAPWLVFAVVSAAMIGVVRPIARRHMAVPRELRSGAAALVGADAKVLSEVTADDGRVKLAGEVWSARSFDGSTVYPEGATVQVLQIEGATALVA